MIESIIKPFVAPIQKRILAPLKTVNALPKLVIKWIKKTFKSILTAKEINKQSYVLIGNYYIQKKLIVICTLIVLCLVYFIFIKPPAFVNRWFNFVPTFHEMPGESLTYSGKAKVFDPGGWFKYEGDLSEGIFQGKGKLYYPQGGVKAQGDFEKGQIKTGEALGPGGELLYTGGFADGLYAGTGTLYYPNGKAQYQGEFQAGKYAGKGKLFDENGGVVYEGGFVSGQYSGDGIAYYPGGAVKYQGQFLAGQYTGSGKLLSETGTVLYEGGFTNNAYSGDGTEYYPAGTAKYKGQFLANKYSGTGQAFYESGKLKYNGGFIAGDFSGEGEAFGEDGSSLYKGKFAVGLYDGLGQLLGKDGKPVFLGYFRAGKPDYTAFLGMSGAKIEELLGKATESTVVDQPTGEPELLLTYRNFQLSFLVRLSPADPKETYIAAVNVSNPESITSFATAFNEEYRKLTKENPKQTALVKSDISVSADERREIYLKDNYFYRFLYAPANTLKELEVTKSGQ